MHKLGPAAQGNLACRNHFSLHFFVQAQKSREGVKRHDFKWRYRPHTFLSLLNNKPLVRGKLGPAAQKRGFARGSILGIHSIASSSGVSRRFLAKGPVGILPPANLEMSYCSGQFLTERGYYRARRWRSSRSLLRCRDGGSKRAPEKSVSQIFLRESFCS